VGGPTGQQTGGVFEARYVDSSVEASPKGKFASVKFVSAALGGKANVGDTLNPVARDPYPDRARKPVDKSIPEPEPAAPKVKKEKTPQVKEPKGKIGRGLNGETASYKKRQKTHNFSFTEETLDLTGGGVKMIPSVKGDPPPMPCMV